MNKILTQQCAGLKKHIKTLDDVLEPFKGQMILEIRPKAKSGYKLDGQSVRKKRYWVEFTILTAMYKGIEILTDYSGLVLSGNSSSVNFEDRDTHFFKMPERSQGIVIPIYSHYTPELGAIVSPSATYRTSKLIKYANGVFFENLPTKFGLTEELSGTTDFLNKMATRHQPSRVEIFSGRAGADLDQEALNMKIGGIINQAILSLNKKAVDYLNEHKQDQPQILMNGKF